MSSSYLSEIHQQPQVIARVADRYPERDANLLEVVGRLQAGGYSHVILTGMGSSLFGCYPLWLALNRHGLPATMWDASELLHHAIEILKPTTFLVVVSQSGESAEIKGLTLSGRRPGVVLGLTNTMASSLAQWADVVLDMSAGDEATVATKTYVATLATLHLLGCQIMQRDLANARSQLHRTAVALEGFLYEWELQVDAAFSFLDGGETLALLGRGESMATALTGALVLQEASKLFTTALSVGQFRHGPLELVRPGFRAVLFAGRRATRDLDARLAREIAGYGGRVLIVAPESPEKKVPMIGELRIPAVEDALLPLVEIVPIQLLAIPLAAARGFVAGVFERGGKVTATE